MLPYISPIEDMPLHHCVNLNHHMKTWGHYGMD
nr:MAG TPA: hypothetical protein [Caudoviricetes sp.]